MGVITTLLAVPITWAAERLLGAGADAVKNRLSNQAAKAELIQIAEAGVEDALGAAPSLREDFRSETFLHAVIAPVVIDRLADPSQAFDPLDLADRYTTRFVTPWVRDGDEAGALARIFQTDRNSIVAALEVFVTSLRKRLFASEHWRDVGRDRTIEETYQGVTYLMEREKRRDPGVEVDLATAHADARIGSRDLLDWQRTIGGLFIARPELDLLAARVRKEPRGRTLLVGEAGSGKSALLSELTERLQSQGMTVFGLKADMLPREVVNSADISRALGLQGDLASELDLLARAGPVVLIIDQLDAVSDIMDRSSQRMKLLLRIANGFRRDPRFEDGPPVHVLVSSRPFEAEHDARFQTLGAEKIKLALPSVESVEGLLKGLAIEAETVPEGLRETLRRPFALRLFVDMVQRDVDVSRVTGADLLNVWLRTADLGDADMRVRVIALFERMASDMTDGETLWRPADAFDAEWAPAVRVGEAAGLIVRQDGQLGFSHQSWLDDFQARGFKTSQQLAAFAWDRQDGLFARATILRALERLRRFDVRAYEGAIDLLLGATHTRRHVKHLVADLLASQDHPTAREQSWVQRLLRSDIPLARRAVSKIWTRWTGWREALKPQLVEVMGSPDLRWASVLLLQAESAVDPAAVIELLNGEWAGQDRDLDVFEVLRRGPLWTPEAARRVSEILARHDIQDFAVANYIDELVKAGRFVEGADLLKLHLEAKRLGRRERLRLYGLGGLVKSAPAAVAAVLTPWFIDLVSAADDHPTLRAAYPRARSLPFNWDDDDQDDSIYHALTHSLSLCAKASTEIALGLLAQVAAVEVDEAQTLVANTYAAHPELFAEPAADFLLADARRFGIGVAHLEDERGGGHLIEGFAARTLLGAIVAHLSRERLLALRRAIEDWDRYRPEVWETSSPADRRMRRGWNDEAKQPLLALLPEDLFDTREQRQRREWAARQPVLRRGSSMAHFVGSPMSAEQMDKAADDDLMRMMDDCPDGSHWGDDRRRKRHISESGGAIQVGRAFAALAKTDPVRVIGLVRDRLSPERHQGVAGDAVHALSEIDDVEPAAVVALIRDLSGRGFDDEDWRRSAAWALQRIAQRTNGLEDSDLDLLESWIVDDAEVVATHIQQRLANEATYQDRERKRDGDPEAARKTPTAVIFGSGGWGSGILPQDNYAMLGAMAAGALAREPAASDLWLAILERHVERAEDPAIWTAILKYHGQSLFWADRERTRALFASVWQRFPEAFTLGVGRRLWSYRAIIPAQVQTELISSWLSRGEAELAQAAGEFAVAADVVSGPSDPLSPVATAIMEGPASAERLGGLFAMASAWRHNAGGLRDRAHQTLLRFAPAANDDEADAIATAIGAERTLLPDERTHELLTMAIDNPALLAATLNGRFADALQELLLHPGFDDVVLALAERGADRLIEDRAGGGAKGMIDTDLVAISIALQRAQGTRRSRAMDLYERLLDAEVYGASEAAGAALRT